MQSRLATYVTSCSRLGSINGITPFHSSQAILYAGSVRFNFSVDTASIVRVARKGSCYLSVRIKVLVTVIRTSRYLEFCIQLILDLLPFGIQRYSGPVFYPLCLLFLKIGTNVLKTENLTKALERR